MSIWPMLMMSADGTLNELPLNDESLLRWRETLDALAGEAEASLGRSGNTLTPEETTGIIDAWEPPAGLGPLPDIFVERARLLVSLQQRAADKLAAARDGVEHELAELTRPRRQVQPLYVDVTG